MGRYAGGNYAIALCDRCGFQYRHITLRKEWNGLRTCIECWEAKHPQIQPIFPPTEPQALFEPRPSRVEPLDVFIGQEIFPFVANISTQGVMQVGVAYAIAVEYQTFWFNGATPVDWAKSNGDPIYWSYA